MPRHTAEQQPYPTPTAPVFDETMFEGGTKKEKDKERDRIAALLERRRAEDEAENVLDTISICCRLHRFRRHFGDVTAFNGATATPDWAATRVFKRLDLAASLGAALNDSVQLRIGRYFDRLSRDQIKRELEQMRLPLTIKALGRRFHRGDYPRHEIIALPPSAPQSEPSRPPEPPQGPGRKLVATPEQIAELEAGLREHRRLLLDLPDGDDVEWLEKKAEMEGGGKAADLLDDPGT